MRVRPCMSGHRGLPLSPAVVSYLGSMPRRLARVLQKRTGMASSQDGYTGSLRCDGTQPPGWRTGGRWRRRLHPDSARGGAGLRPARRKPVSVHGQSSTPPFGTISVATGRAFRYCFHPRRRFLSQCNGVCAGPLPSNMCANCLFRKIPEHVQTRRYGWTGEIIVHEPDRLRRCPRAHGRTEAGNPGS